MIDLSAYGWRPALAHSFAACAERNTEPARIIAHHRGQYRVITQHGMRAALCAGRLRHHPGAEGLPVIGDFVAVRIDAASATIEAVLPRHSKFARAVGDLTRTHATQGEQIIAANVDLVFIVTGADGDFSVRRLERLLSAAWGSNAIPHIVLTKTDLGQAEPLISDLAIAAPGVAVHPVSNLTKAGIANLRALIGAGQTALLVGSSGVGKSSLVNALAETEQQAVQPTDINGRGRHTTTSRDLIMLQGGGLVLDTPGIRAITAWQADGLADTFGEITLLASACRFTDCQHQNEPGCAITAAIATGALDARRLRDFHKLSREQAYLARRDDKRAESAAKRQWKAVSKQARAGRRLD